MMKRFMGRLFSALVLAFVGCSSTPDAESTPTPPGSGEACGDVACTTAPASRCVDETSVESFASSGTCVDGACQYASTRNACAEDEACRDGVCVHQGAVLSSLEISPGELVYDATQTHYVVTVPVDAASVNVTAKTAHALATITVDGRPAESGALVPVGFDVSQRQRKVSIRVVAPSGTVTTYNVLLLRFGHQAYVKPSNQGGYFGRSVAISIDGATLAVAAHDESSGAVGVDGYGAAGAATGSGAVYVFHRDDAGVWKQEAYVKASNPGAFDNFGWSVALSGDGGTLAVGALNEDSNARGINGDQANNSATNSGAAYVFRRAPTGKWSQEAYVKAPTPRASDFFGRAVALSYDGAALAVGGKRDAAAAERPNAVFVFRRAAAGTWSQEAALEAGNSSFYHYFGAALAFSKSGTTLAVGDPGEDGDAVGINGPYNLTSGLTDSGAVYVFLRSASGAWSQEAYVKASNTGAGDSFGTSVALSSDGATLAVGARGEGSNSRGVNSNQTNNDASRSGAAYVFHRNEVGAWAQSAYVKASNTETEDEFGGAIALSGDGSVLAVGATSEGSSARGIGGAQTSAGPYFDAGAVYLFRRNGAGAWSQARYIKASNTEEGDAFGSGVALSVDGRTLAVGADSEDSAATGIDGNQGDNAATNSGAVYVFAL